MAKELNFGDEARENLLDGVNQLANAVKSAKSKATAKGKAKAWPCVTISPNMTLA